MISQASPNSVAAFIAEPVAGATLGAAVPCEDYWPSIVEVCRRHGVLVIADEVMTGMGRTGRWFGCDHWDVRPDILTAGKGTTSGYVPFGFAAASGEVFDAVSTTGFVHGFTWSHNGLGAAAARRCCASARARPGCPRRDDGPAAARRSRGGARRCGDRRRRARARHDDRHRARRDRDTKEPFARADRVTERVLGAARDDGLLLYSSSPDGVGRDDLVVGPPF